MLLLLLMLLLLMMMDNSEDSLTHSLTQSHWEMRSVLFFSPSTRLSVERWCCRDAGRQCGEDAQCHEALIDLWKMGGDAQSGR